MKDILNLIKGDGVHDDADALQQLLNSGEKEIYIPQGCYLVGKTLKIHSNTNLTAHPNARFIMDGCVQKKRGDFLITNSDHVNGNQNIHINGGVWDGNNAGKGNEKPDIFDKNGYSGTVINFFNIKNLQCENMIIANSVTYNIRIGAVEDFRLENISFLSDCFGVNQDGLHISGRVRNGLVKNIRALSKGQTNDDMIALNADDSIERVENLDLYRDSIENITFENIYAEDCHTIIRILSVRALIKNITIKNVYGGYRYYAINCDAARYCRTPLFNDADYPNGVGNIQDFLIENITVYPTVDNNLPAICLESLASNFIIKNFNFINRFNIDKKKTAFQMKNVSNLMVTTDIEEYKIDSKNENLIIPNFSELEINYKIKDN